MATDDIFSQLAVVTRENIEAGIYDATLKTDDPAWTAITQRGKIVSMGGRDVLNAPGGSSEPGYFADWRIKVQRGGTVQAGRWDTDTVEKVGAQSHILTGQIGGVYPDPTKSPMRSHISCRMKLKKMDGMMTLNREQVNQKMFTEPLEDMAVDIAADAMFHARHYYMCNAYSDGPGILARVNNGAGYAVGEGSNRKTVLIKEGTPFRFIKGQRYVAGSFVAAASRGASNSTARAGTLTTPGEMICVSIKIKERSVTLESAPGEGTITLTDGDALYKANTHDFGASTFNGGVLVNHGFESLLLDSGLFPGAYYGSTQLNCDDHEELRSFIFGTEGTLEPPTPEKLSEVIDYLVEAQISVPAMMVAEPSLWSLYSILEKRAAAHYTVPQGGPFTASGGIQGPVLSHQERTFARFSSSIIRPGMVLGLAPDTWKKFFPSGVGSIMWVVDDAGLAGTSGVFFPVLTDGGRRITKVSQAPFEGYGELGCEDPRANFRRVGFHSQRTF